MYGCGHFGSSPCADPNRFRLLPPPDFTMVVTPEVLAMYNCFDFVPVVDELPVAAVFASTSHLLTGAVPIMRQLRVESGGIRLGLEWPFIPRRFVDDYIIFWRG